MTEIAPVPLPKAYLLLNHGPTVLVTSAHGGRRNVMAASWAMPLEFPPPLVRGCVAWLECRVVPEPHNESRHDLFFGQVVAARAATDVFADGRWRDVGPERRTIHYPSGGRFFACGDSFAA